MQQKEMKRCKECQKHTERSEAEKKRLMNRLKRIEGQVRGLQKMLEQNAYCPDILTQSAAVNAAIHAFNKDLLIQHIRTCVVRDLRAGDDSVIEELSETIQKLMK